MRITIVAIGKLKEKYWRDAVNEYSKRLTRFCNVSIIEVQEEYCPDNPSDSIIEKVKAKEGEKILKKIKDDSYVIVLDVKGKQMTSEAFADIFQSQVNRGKSSFVFIIGGSYGLSKEVVARGNFVLSMSDMTFPHQMARVIILEQIYRAFKINNNETYHK